MNAKIDLNGKNILVTGASGFIGSRLVEYLVSGYHANVRALVRTFGRAVHIARLPVHLIPGDITDPESLRQAISGCDIVFHCAAGISGDDDERTAATVDGTRNMLEAAVEANVQRFVHVSTVAVHGADPGPVIDENTPLIKSGNLYADTKLEAEKLVLQYGMEKGLPVAILRPTIVYGPRSGSWTLAPVNNIRAGSLALIDDGQGIANQVYVDDVVQALLLAATRPEAVGEVFVVSNGNGVTWKEFFGYYARMLGADIPSISLEHIDRVYSQASQLRNPFYLGLSFVASPHAQAVVKQIPGLSFAFKGFTRVLPKKIKTSITGQAAELRELKINPPSLPNPWTVKLYTAKGVCKIDKARRLLGYQPQVSLAEGMRLTEAWLRYNRLILG